MSDDEGRLAWATAGAVAAGALMITVGLFQLFEGIAAVASDRLFAEVGDYTFAIDTTGWGWIHIVLGALLALVGVFVLKGSGWAYGVGIGLAAVSALNQFFFLPYYPLWGLVIIAFCVFVIWALAVVLAEVNSPS
ncbi:hypothetical protein GCM10009853_027530 [Glycomyces scopariae]|uniref:DUF7144 domain-containing protein n=1 Tax=Glycomyces sambucus TaxID=380244 RepID=A0A1G9FLC6_9ACTN|nr:hypothetical protein [Glycomyces sambucus]SDK89169.1 hypothetical protein SAMN05216298_1878 [Glycomyces sambucus]